MLPEWRIERHASLASTSDLLLERLRTGEARAGDVIVAEVQTAGRGRQGRIWVSEPGGLWLTTALPVGTAPMGQMALVTAVAACEAVRRQAPAVGVKWPNDLVASGRKVGGILVECPAGAALAAVGIGINVARAPSDAASAPLAGALADFAAAPVTPEDLLPLLLDALRARWQAWLSGAWPQIRDAWQAMDAARGHKVLLKPQQIEGVADGIDDEGRLRVRRTDGAVLAASVGEVVFRNGGGGR